MTLEVRIVTNMVSRTPLEKVVSNLRLLGGKLCLDFANTVEYRGSEREFDFLPDYALFIRWSVHAGALSQGAAVQPLIWAESPEAESVWAQALRLRQTIYRLFVACTQKQEIPADVLAAFNAVLRDCLAHRQIAPTADGFTWVWQRQDSLGWMLWPIALSAAELLTSGQLDRVRQCPGCGWLFFDTSRNGQRAWCDMRVCGNRAKAQRHYRRQQNK
jgi:predicted RNA-binding Zn ribbon-like protein